MPMTPSPRGHARRAPLLALLLVLPLPAAAEMLYKCVDAAGITAIQMDPCAKGTRQVWARESAPEAPPTPEQVAAAQARAEATARERAEAEARFRAAEEEAEAQRLAAEAAKAVPPAQDGKGATAAPSTPPPAPDPCDEAKAFAAEVRGKTWLGLERAQMQRIYGWVAQECAKPKSEE